MARYLSAAHGITAENSNNTVTVLGDSAGGIGHNRAR